MNFQDIMAKAAENQESKKAQLSTTKRYNTAIPPPKKVVRQKGISPNVMAFLAKKEEESKRKAEDQKKCRERYLQKSKQCYRKVQNIHELLKEGDEKEETDKELVHVEPSSNNAAEEANTKFFQNSNNSSSSPKSESHKTDTAKKKRKGNAPSYSELLKMAADAKKNTQKEKNVKARPMTAKEKDEMERQADYKKSKEYRIWREYGPAALEKYKAQQRFKENDGKPSDDDDKGHVEIGVKNTGAKRASDGKPVTGKPGSQPAGNVKKVKAKQQPVKEVTEYASTNENVLVCRPSEPTLTPWDRLRAEAPQKMKSRFNVVVDSESEESDYDEEDDFIDDGPLENDPFANNISNHIRNIFGYDKRKFRDFDDDDTNMEASYQDQMKEEARSARLGLKEDLEDIRREEEELKRKRTLKKKMKR